ATSPTIYVGAIDQGGEHDHRGIGHPEEGGRGQGDSVRERGEANGRGAVRGDDRARRAGAVEGLFDLGFATVQKLAAERSALDPREVSEMLWVGRKLLDIPELKTPSRTAGSPGPRSERSSRTSPRRMRRRGSRRRPG